METFEYCVSNDFRGAVLRNSIALVNRETYDYSELESLCWENGRTHGCFLPARPWHCDIRQIFTKLIMRATRSKNTTERRSESPISSAAKGEVRHNTTELVKRTLPDRSFVVFFRIGKIKELNVGQLAAAQQSLALACSAENSRNPKEVLSIHSSVYGRLVCMRDVIAGLLLALRIIETMAKKGVALNTAITVGRLEHVDDLGRANVNGPPINRAARMTALEIGGQKIVVDENVFKAVCEVSKEQSKRFSKSLNGSVKRTKFTYRIFSKHSLVRGQITPLGRNKFRSFEAHVVVFDIARFSEKADNAQWLAATEMRKIVGDVLTVIGGQNRVNQSMLWYAPAGDGGVLVFLPENEGGGTAWLFVQELARRCKPNLKIRLGVSTGSVAVVEENLPVGTAILRADKLCGYPDNWQVCVDKTFWDGRPAEDREYWQTKSVRDDKNALIVTGKPEMFADSKAKQSAKTETGPSNSNSQMLFGHIVKRVQHLLAQNPRLRSELEKELKSHNAPEVKTAIDIVEMVFLGELNKVLQTIYHVLGGHIERDDAAQIAEMLDGLVALGVDAAWVKRQRKHLVDKNGQVRGGIVSVPRITEMASAEIIKAALVDGPAYWRRGAPASLPVGEDGFDGTPGVEPRSPILASRLEEFRSYLLKKCVIRPNDPDAQRKLEEHLEVRWNEKKPLYALFGETDSLQQGIAQDLTIPWHYILVMQQSVDISEVLPKPRAVAVWIKDILERVEHLDRLHLSRKTET